MFVVSTKVKIKKGEIKDVLKLFKETNPELVEHENDWLKAYFTADEENDSVKVLAFWKKKESYQKFSASEKFKTTMAGFAKHFESPPQVEINKLLFEM